MSPSHQSAQRGAPPHAQRVEDIPLSKIRFDPTQPRKAFHHIDGRIEPKDDDYIKELAESIRDKKLIHAITVQEKDDGTYLVVVGECRTRAHLLLAWPTIRAVIRNDLVDPAQRLLFQLAENVNRSDLTDYELALSIRALMQGAHGNAPMKQVHIAQAMGKSEGWVSRFVKFGDEELQRAWFRSGIADTVEKLYRLAGLPMHIQVDVRRRVGLPEGDPERLDKPLNRDIIDGLMRDAKGADRAAKNRHVLLAPGAPQAGRLASAAAGGAGDDPIGLALALAAAEGRASASPPGPVTGGYRLSPEARAKILGTIPDALAGAGKGGGAEVQPPVSCRISVANVLAMAHALQSTPALQKAMAQVWCDMSLPGSLAQSLANELMGVVVDEREVPAVVQNALAKLR